VMKPKPAAEHDWESFLLVIVYSLQRRALQRHSEPKALQMFRSIFGATGIWDVSLAKGNVLRKNPGIDKYLDSDLERQLLLQCRILIHSQTDRVLEEVDESIQYDKVKKLFDSF
jgi:hypothetical protein